MPEQQAHYFGNRSLDAPPLSQPSARLPLTRLLSKRAEDEMAITGVPGTRMG